MDHDEDLFAQFDTECGRDMPLSGSWRLKCGSAFKVLKPDVCTPKTESALSMLLANLLAASKYGVWVSYSRDRNHYTGKQFYHGQGFSYRSVAAAVEILLDAQLVEEERRAQNRHGLRSRLRATPQLCAVLAHAVVEHWVCQLIQLKDEHKDLVAFEDDEITRRMRREMEEVNESIASVVVDRCPTGLLTATHGLHGPRLIFPQRWQLHRTFNNLQFIFGGRLYGGYWQVLPKVMRRGLVINGEPVAEPDHAQLHPRLLYAEFGILFSGQAYEIDGYERHVVKHAFQLMVNCKSRPQAVATMVRYLCQSCGFEAFASAQLYARQLLAALEAHHVQIAKAFYTCVAPRLQFSDSELLLCVLRKMRDRGVVGLPVHDSIICRKSDEPFVSGVMEECLHSLLSDLKTGRAKIITA